MPLVSDYCVVLSLMSAVRGMLGFHAYPFPADHAVLMLIHLARPGLYAGFTYADATLWFTSSFFLASIGVSCVRIFVGGGTLRTAAAALPRYPAPDRRKGRVICCYPAFEMLLRKALGHAERYFAYSYPRDRWYVRAVIAGENSVRRLKRNPFRAFVHPVTRMPQTIERAGFRLAARRRSWQGAAEVWVR